MNEFQSQSQAGQDRFAWELLGPGPCSFLDIGSGHPSIRSNSFALEQMGWTGFLVEQDAHCVGLIKSHRKAELIEHDATQIHWDSILGAPCCIDYLSLDVDWDSLAVLKSLMESGARFRVLTVEADQYRFGNERRDEMVSLLTSKGYDILCADVSDNGLPFEIWAVDQIAVDMDKAERFRRSGEVDWKEFFV